MYFLFVQLFIRLYAFFTNLLLEFSITILECPLLIMSPFVSIFFNEYFWFISSRCIVSLVSRCLLPSLIFNCVLLYLFFLSVFSCSRRFFICTSCLISSFFLIFIWDPLVGGYQFYHWLVWFLLIFKILISTLTLVQFWQFTDGKVLLFSVIIYFLINSTFFVIVLSFFV